MLTCFSIILVSGLFLSIFESLSTLGIFRLTYKLAKKKFNVTIPFLKLCPDVHINYVITLAICGYSLVLPKVGCTFFIILVVEFNED